MTAAGGFHSQLDERFGVPGDARQAAATACAAHYVSPGTTGGFDEPPWQELQRIDADAGFHTRFAARGLLRRQRDGRFLLFRYPFRDGSRRFIIPGGGAEPGEDVETALRREVLEETGTVPRDLRPTGLLLFHLLASTIHDEGRTPTVQYSPVLFGTIDDELPDTGGREALWFTTEEFESQPRRPISEPLLDVLRAWERGAPPAATAVWLPA